MSTTVPSAISDRLLINRIPLRGAEMDRLFVYVGRHPGVTYDALVRRYVPAGDGVFGETNDELLKEAIGFMLTAGLLTLVTNSNAWAKRTFAVPDSLVDEPFTLALLRCLQAQTEPRQRAMAGVYEHLVRQDALHVPVGHAHRLMERSEWGGLFTWNEEKIRFWQALYGYAGLLTALDENGFFLVPRLATLRAVFSRYPGGPSVGLRSLLEFVESTYFTCFTAKGRLHRGLACALEEMADREQIRFHHQADAARSVLVGGRRVSEVTFTWPA